MLVQFTLYWKEEAWRSCYGTVGAGLLKMSELMQFLELLSIAGFIGVIFFFQTFVYILTIGCAS